MSVLVRAYKSKNSTYYRYFDVDKWYCSTNSEEKFLLENAKYVSIDDAEKIWKESEDKNFSELEKLINEVKNYGEVGGRIVSIIKEDGKIKIRRSGIIKNIVDGTL